MWFTFQHGHILTAERGSFARSAHHVRDVPRPHHDRGDLRKMPEVRLMTFKRDSVDVGCQSALFSREFAVITQMFRITVPQQRLWKKVS